MKSLVKTLFSLVFLFGLALLILLLPSIIESRDGGLSFRWDQAWRELQRFGEDLLAGRLFVSYLGSTPRNLVDLFPSAFGYSLLYLLLPAGMSLAVGLSLGMVLGLQRGKRGSRVLSLLGVVGIIPDFVLALILIIGAVYFYQATGIRVARIANFGGVGSLPPLTIPLTTMTLVAAVYLVRLVYSRTREIGAAPYILFARAKGLPEGRIRLTHILPGVLDYVKSDLYKVLAILMGSLFIIERYFSLPGLTRLLFGFGFSITRVSGRDAFYYQAQFGLSLMCLAGLMLAFFTARILLGLLLRLARRGVSHG